MSNTIGAVGTKNNPAKEQPKRQPKKFELKEWDVESVKEDLKSQIEKIINSQSYTTLSKLSASYLLDTKHFRAKCMEDDELNNLLNIYNSVYVEDVMTNAIKTGKINTQTESWLKNELQAYTGSGFEQKVVIINHPVEFEDLEVDVDINEDDKSIIDIVKESK